MIARRRSDGASAAEQGAETLRTEMLRSVDPDGGGARSIPLDTVDDRLAHAHYAFRNRSVGFCGDGNVPQASARQREGIRCVRNAGDAGERSDRLDRRHFLHNSRKSLEP
jgi:hypothetical protein